MKDNDLSKLIKKLPNEFIDSVNSMNDEEIKQRILSCEQHVFDIQEAQENDEELQKAKEVAKEIASQYREPKALEGNKIKYLLMILEQRGISLAK